MKSLVYILAITTKNTFLEVLKKPSKLVLWLLVILGIGGFMILSMTNTIPSQNSVDFIWLKGIIFILILIYFVIFISNGLSSGSVIFDMSDVNLLFVSPVSPKLILMYGIIRIAKASFWMGFFILFQGASLKTNFGVEFKGILTILAGFILSAFLLQILSMIIYSKTNGRPKLKLAVKISACLCFLPLAIYTAVQFVQNGSIFAALESALNSAFFSWTPIAGWASEGILSFITGNNMNAVLFLGLIILTGLLLILYISLSNPDYFEDVLVATETAFEKRRRLSEGQINQEGNSKKRIKEVKSGIKGTGAKVFFYKHLREAFRSNFFGLWNITSLMYAAVAVVMSLITKGENAGILILLQVIMWMQIFLIGTGRGLRELYSHYIYMVPDSSFSKIIWSNLEIVFKVLVEAVVIFTISGIIQNTGILNIAAAILAYTLFSFLLLGVNFVSLRWTGSNISGGLMIFLYMFAVILIMLPGLIPAIIIGSMLGEAGIFIGMLIAAVWELIASLICFSISKGILHNCDIPSVKMNN